MRNNCLSAVVHSLVCKCSAGIGCGEDHMHQNLTCNITDGMCYKKIELDGDTEVIYYGCMDVPIHNFQCKSDFSLHTIRRGVLCCKSKDLCNEDLVPTLPPVTTPPKYLGTVL